MSNDSKKASSHRILIIDDDPRVVVMLREMLKSEYLVDAVSSGGEALLKVSKKSYPTVICDIGLPDMRGTSVLKALAENHPNLPVIMHTMEDSQTLRQECSKAGAFAFLTKPCTSDELKRVVREAVGSDFGNQE